jgi:2-methylisocitrate lyase-like PEP mutase family enzyme
LPLLTFEPEIQAETGQKWLINPAKRLQNASEVPVLVDNGNSYAREQRTADDTVKAFSSIR